MAAMTSRSAAVTKLMHAFRRTAAWQVIHSHGKQRRQSLTAHGIFVDLQSSPRQGRRTDEDLYDCLKAVRLLLGPLQSDRIELRGRLQRGAKRAGDGPPTVERLKRMIAESSVAAVADRFAVDRTTIWRWLQRRDFESGDATVSDATLSEVASRRRARKSHAGGTD